VKSDVKILDLHCRPVHMLTPSTSANSEEDGA